MSVQCNPYVSNTQHGKIMQDSCMEQALACGYVVLTCCLLPEVAALLWQNVQMWLC